MKEIDFVDMLFAALDTQQDDCLFQGVAVKSLDEEHGFDSVQFVDGRDSNRVEKLNDLMELGGDPFGIVSMAKDGQRVFYQPLPGHEEDLERLRLITELHMAYWSGDWSRFPLIQQGPGFEN